MRAENSGEKILVEKLSAGKKVIPLFFRNGDTWHTDIKLPAIVLTNQSNSPVSIEGIAMVGYSGNREVIRLYQDRESIAQVQQKYTTLLNKILKSSRQWGAYNRGMLYGKITAQETEYTTATTVEPGASACLGLNELFNFHFAGHHRIDRVDCQITLSSAGETSEKVFPIELTPYQCKGDYIFPVRGRCTIVGTPWNRVMGHRLATSQEFAFDVVDYRVLEAGGFSLSSPPNSDTVREYFFFERAVLAVGDGVVAASGNQWPNAWAENPLINPDDRIIEQSQKLLDAGVEFTHVILGNYTIIDHQNGEYSVYAHMSEGTVTVQPGDAVKQGDVIGKIGNTSNSDCPHLHFHLMDSPDFITANGLPVMFTNLPHSQAPLYDFSEANSLLYSDYLFVHIQE